MWIPEWVVNTLMALGAVVGLTTVILVVERWREQRGAYYDIVAYRVLKG